MSNLDSLIRNNLDMPISEDVSIYKDVKNKKKFTNEICEIVNTKINKTVQPYDKDILEDIRTNGYAVVENFISSDEIEELKKYISNFKGYQFHIPNRSFNKIPEKYSSDLNWNVCSYKTNHLLHNPFILKLMTKPEIISLVQEYLGCLPMISGLNIWWNKYTGQEFHTQKLHRDYDDFKFITMFIYLTDVNTKNGPHVYYPKTHNGEDPSAEPIEITAKAGTAIFGDTYALHYGKPLEEGERLMLWTRFSLHKNNNFYRDGSEEYMQEPSVFFDVIDDNDTNRHVLRAFTK
jgi:hypothetical protein